MRIMGSIFIFVIAAAATSNAQVAESQTADLWDTRTVVMYRVIELPQDDKKKFFRVFDEYDEKLIAIDKAKNSLILEYFNNSANLTDEKADDYVERLFDIKEDTLALNKKYYKRIKKEFGAVIGARFLQTMNIVINQHDQQFATRLPLAH